MLGPKASRSSQRETAIRTKRPEIIVSKRLVAINSMSSVLSKAINMTVILWSYQYILKRISAEEFAVLPVVTSLMMFAPLFFSLFTGGISRYVVEAYAREDFDGITRITSSIFPPLAAVALAFLCIGLVIATQIEHIFNIAPTMTRDAHIMMALLVCSFCLQMLGTPFSVGFFVLQRFVQLNLLGVARDLLRVALLFALLLGAGPRVIWVVVATTAAQTAHTAVVVVSSRRMVPELRFRPRSFERGQMGMLLGFGFWTTLGRLGGVMYTTAATILLNLFGTAVDVTSYHVGATFFRQIDSTIKLAAQPTQTILTKMHTTGNDDRLARVVFRGGRYAMWAALFVATPLIVFADDFVMLYLGASYSQTALVIILFMLIFPFTSPTALLGLTSIAKAKVRGFNTMAFVFQFVGLIVMIAVVTRTNLGATGMALSLCAITILSQMVYYWGLCLRLTGRTLGEFLRRVVVPGLKPALAGIVIWVPVDALASQQSWLWLLVSVSAGSAVYVATLILAGIDRQERSDALRLFHKLSGRRFVKPTSATDRRPMR